MSVAQIWDKDEAMSSNVFLVQPTVQKHAAAGLVVHAHIDTYVHTLVRDITDICRPRVRWDEKIFICPEGSCWEIDEA